MTHRPGQGTRHPIIKFATHLSQVGLFPVQDSFGGEFDVRIRGDDHGTLAAKLESERSDVLCGSCGDNTADAVAASVEDVLPAKFKELRRLFHSAVDNGVSIGVEILGEEIGKCIGDSGAQFGRFDDGGASCGNRTHKWPEGDNVRVIPWPIAEVSTPEKLTGKRQRHT